LTERHDMRMSEETYKEQLAKRTRWQKGSAIVNTEQTPPAAPSKYKNVKTDGYASKKEARRAHTLKLMAEAGQIRNLREQVPYVLIPRQLGPDGKVQERACGYVADFVFEEFSADGWREVVEDCKGMRTDAYIIKRKLMRFTHGISIRET
jgi:hypothetical protein